MMDSLWCYLLSSEAGYQPSAKRGGTTRGEPLSSLTGGALWFYGGDDQLTSQAISPILCVPRGGNP